MYPYSMYTHTVPHRVHTQCPYPVSNLMSNPMSNLMVGGMVDIVLDLRGYRGGMNGLLYYEMGTEIFLMFILKV